MTEPFTTTLGQNVSNDGFAGNVKKAIASHLRKADSSIADSSFLPRHREAIRKLAEHAGSLAQQDQALALLQDVQAARGKDSDTYDVTATQSKLLDLVGISREPEATAQLWAEFIRFGCKDAIRQVRGNPRRENDLAEAAQREQERAEGLEAKLRAERVKRELAESERGQLNARLIVAEEEVAELREALSEPVAVGDDK